MKKDVRKPELENKHETDRSGEIAVHRETESEVETVWEVCERRGGVEWALDGWNGEDS